MKLLNNYIAPKIILNILIVLAVSGTAFILLSVHRINSLLSREVYFDKDSTFCLKVKEDRDFQIGSLVSSTVLPGFHSKELENMKAGDFKSFCTIAQQKVTPNFFDLFKYKIISENKVLFYSTQKQLAYLNERAMIELGIDNADEALGKSILYENGKELVICGVVKDYPNLCIRPGVQAKVFQLSDKNQSYIFSAIKPKEENYKSFQESIQNHYKYIEDMMYSIFLCINIIILLAGITTVGLRYSRNKEKGFYKLLSIGVNILVIILSKSYFYLIAIIGVIAGPLAFLIQKFWLEVYDYRIHFGLVDLFIILSVVVFSLYSAFFPQLKTLKKHS